MTTGAVQKGSLIRLVLALLVVLFGLCTIFASIVTMAQAWQEHAQARWPEVMARVEESGFRQTSTGRRDKYYIRCRLSYTAGAEQHTANIYSRTVPPPEQWQYPANQMAPFSEWLDAHPRGTPVLVRYNPADYRKIVLVGNEFPGGGPRTPSNVKLVEMFAGGFVVLLTMARITRPRSPEA
jgi:hypothetical protein